MLSKAQNKYIRSLTQQKYRKEHNSFIAEGDKISREWLISDEKIQLIVGLADWIAHNENLIQRHSEAQVYIVDEQTLTSVSALQTPNKALLVVNMPEKKQHDKNVWCIALDDIQDPGNMGTIIRTADWFGINQIVCSPGCVDVYNSKVIQSAMGSHLRVQLQTAVLTDYLSDVPLPILAATLDGENIYTLPKQSEKALIIIGNEGRGISPDVLNKATRKITIPRSGKAESLNAAVSAGILCALLVGC